MNWFSTGDEELENVLAGREEKKNKVQRFWLKVGEEARTTFIDDTLNPSTLLGGKVPPIQLYEHQIQLNGSWFNYFTCLGRDCPVCLVNSPYFVRYYTVIDHREYTATSGKVYRDVIKLYGAKAETAKVLNRAFAKKGNGQARGLTFDISRDGNKTPNTGGQFDFIEKIELPDDIQPVNYLELLAPKDKENLMALLGQNASNEENTIPF